MVKLAGGVPVMIETDLASGYKAPGAAEQRSIPIDVRRGDPVLCNA
ncbi:MULTISPECIES: hypothetical protein [Sorangium]